MGEDIVDEDLEFVVDVFDHAHFMRVALAIAASLRKRGWLKCDFSSYKLTCFLCEAESHARQTRVSASFELTFLTLSDAESRLHGTYAGRSGIPIDVVHPLGRCKAYNTTTPCIRQPSQFFIFWRQNEYQVDKYCLALPKWTPERLMFRANSSWLADGIQRMHMTELEDRWASMERQGFQSMSHIWRTHPACLSARDAIVSAGAFEQPGLSQLAAREVTRIKKDVRNHRSSSPLSKGIHFASWVRAAQASLELEQFNCGEKYWPYGNGRAVIIVDFGRSPLMNPHLSWWSSLKLWYDKGLQLVDESFFHIFRMLSTALPPRRGGIQIGWYADDFQDVLEAQQFHVDLQMFSHPGPLGKAGWSGVFTSFLVLSVRLVRAELFLFLTNQIGTIPETDDLLFEVENLTGPGGVVHSLANGTVLPDVDGPVGTSCDPLLREAALRLLRWKTGTFSFKRCDVIGVDRIVGAMLGIKSTYCGGDLEGVHDRILRLSECFRGVLP